MKLLRNLGTAIAALALSAAAFAQIHDSGAGGGIQANITAGSINCAASGTGGCTIQPNSLYGIVGTVTNDSANAGAVGEVLQTTVATGSAVSLTTATAANMASLTLTPGDWEVTAQCDHNWSGTTATIETCGISYTSATQLTQVGGASGGVTIGYDPLVTLAQTFGTTITGTYDVRTNTVRVQVAAGASSPTIYAVATATFSAGTDTVFGTIRARRVR